ncbi:MAG: zinc-dependent metalloprotease [Saprospiraceae bacterium]|nr:zinc-dependent metalloprotease [Saprospiraceae bacterium]
MTAEATLISEDPSGAFMWSGKLTTSPDPGYVSFVIKDSQTAGFIQIGADFYEISPINSTYQLLAKRNNALRNANGCGTSPDSLSSPPEGPDDCDYFPEYNTCPALITVLLILTPEAVDIVKNLYGSVDLFALLGQSSVNTALWNSDIPNKEIRVKWVVKDGFSFSSLPDPHHWDLKALPLFSEPERTIQQADQVVFIPHIDYPDVGGVANLPDLPDPNRAFSIVEPGWFLGEFALAHELGHNWGLRHNWPIDIGNDPTKVCAHGKRWIPLNTFPPIDWYQEIPTWRTLMATPIKLDADYPFDVNGVQVFAHFTSDYPILHYSNPSVSYNGEPTGRALGKIADNADHFRKYGCEINDYYETNELEVYVTVSPCAVPITLTADINPPDAGLPGVGPYTVYWFWNTSGVFGNGGSQQLLGTGTTLNLNSHPACPVFWIKCIVVSSDNVAISRIQKVTLGNCDCIFEEIPGHQREDHWESSSFESVKIYPNPVLHDYLLIEGVSSEYTEIPWKILDAQGRLCLEGQTYVISSSPFSIPIHDLNNGLYLLSIPSSGGKTESHKFVIAKNE